MKTYFLIFVLLFAGSALTQTPAAIPNPTMWTGAVGTTVNLPLLPRFVNPSGCVVLPSGGLSGFTISNGALTGKTTQAGTFALLVTCTVSGQIQFEMVRLMVASPPGPPVAKAPAPLKASPTKQP